MKLGKTNKFPQGKLTKDDEGELKLAVIKHENKVIVNFGTPVTWLGLDKATAIEFAEAILKYANTIE